MKNRAAILGAALLLAAPFATPALADPSGFISIGVGPGSYVWQEGPDEDTMSGYAIRGAASGVYNFTPALGVQGDVSFAYTNYEDGDFEAQEIDGALHGFFREPDSFLVGGFVQLGRENHFVDGSAWDSYDRVYLGGETQVYLDNLTLYGQAGMQQITPDADFAPTFSGWFGRLEARYFLTPDLRIEAHAGFDTQSFLTALTATTLRVGIGAEYKLENQPVSLFATYDFSTSSNNEVDDLTLSEHRVLLGAKFALGEESLLDRDRNGASLSPIRTTFSPLAFFSGNPP